MPMVSVLLLAFQAKTAVPPPVARDLDVTGTWQVRICIGQCSDTTGGRVVEAGMLVLDTVPDLDYRENEGRRGCHVVGVPAARPKPIDPHSFVWRRPAGTDSIVFPFWSGIDYGVAASLVFSDSGLSGTLRDWSPYRMGTGRIRYLQGYRVGPPDKSICAPLHHSELPMVLGFLLGAGVMVVAMVTLR